MQWTTSNRKKGLKNMAKAMDLDISVLNAKLAFFRKEMKNGYKKPWKEICNSDSYDEVTKIFLDKIKIVGVRNLTTRSKYSATILKYMKSHNCSEP